MKRRERCCKAQHTAHIVQPWRRHGHGHLLARRTVKLIGDKIVLPEFNGGGKVLENVKRRFGFRFLRFRWRLFPLFFLFPSRVSKQNPDLGESLEEKSSAT